MQAPTFRIWFEKLVVPDFDEALPLSQISEDKHIHGGLRLEISGRLVPYLGYFGPDDVCLDTWLEELWAISEAFKSPQGRYVFDEGEQGQPAYVFERCGDRAFFSIAPSEISEVDGDPDWRKVEFSPEEFLTQHTAFREAFITTIRAAAGSAADQWLQRVDPGSRVVSPQDS